MAKKKFVLMHHSRNREQMDIHKRILEDGVCPFCWKNFLKYHKNPILKKSKNWIVTNNAWPYNGTKTHLLFVFKRHIEHINKLKNTEWNELNLLIKKFAPKSGGSLFIRFGDADKTGASVTHLHCHIICGGNRKDKNTDKLLVQLGYIAKK